MVEWDRIIEDVTRGWNRLREATRFGSGRVFLSTVVIRRRMDLLDLERKLERLYREIGLRVYERSERPLEEMTEDKDIESLVKEIYEVQRERTRIMEDLDGFTSPD